MKAKDLKWIYDNAIRQGYPKRQLIPAMKMIYQPSEKEWNKFINECGFEPFQIH